MRLLSKLFGFGGTADKDISSAINNGAFLVDVRSEGEFKAGSIEGAVNIPVDLITSKIDSFKGKQQIVVFCRSGNRSRAAKYVLLESGINNVIDAGSIQSLKDLLNK